MLLAVHRSNDKLQEALSVYFFRLEAKKINSLPRFQAVLFSPDQDLIVPLRIYTYKSGKLPTLTQSQLNRIKNV